MSSQHSHRGIVHLGITPVPPQVIRDLLYAAPGGAYITSVRHTLPLGVVCSAVGRSVISIDSRHDVVQCCVGVCARHIAMVCIVSISKSLNGRSWYVCTWYVCVTIIVTAYLEVSSRA